MADTSPVRMTSPSGRPMTEPQQEVEVVQVTVVTSGGGGAPSVAQQPLVRRSFFPFLSILLKVFRSYSQAPFERALMIHQVEAELKQAGILVGLHRGFVDILQRIYYEEGFFALYRGNTANVIQTIVQGTAGAFVPDSGQPALANRSRGIGAVLREYARTTFAQMFSSAVAYPWELAMHILRADVAYKMTRDPANMSIVTRKTWMFSGIINVFKKMLDRFGYLGLFKGLSAVFLNAFLQTVIAFTLYDSFRLSVREDGTINYTRVALALLLVVPLGLLTFVGAYAVAVAQKRYIIGSISSPDKYRDILDCMQSIYNNEGLMNGLLKGVGVSFVMSILGLVSSV
jgi:hypothetical protein